VSFLPPQAHQGPVASVLNPVGAYNFWITLIDSPRNPATASAVQQLQGALLAVESMVLAGFSECTGLEMQMRQAQPSLAAPFNHSLGCKCRRRLWDLRGGGRFRDFLIR